MADRIFGKNEAAAMFESIYDAMARDHAGETAGRHAGELQIERELLLKSRSALSALLRAVGTENFNRAGGEMSTNLRAAIRQAEEALDD